MSEPRLTIREILFSPRALVVLAPFVLLAPVWLAGKALYWGTPGTQFIPWWWQAWESIQQGQIPLWNPELGMGAPLLANYQSALFYPPTWSYFALASMGGLPAMAWWQAIMQAIHLAWAGLGMLLLLHRLGLNQRAQLVGSLAFSLSGFLVARAHFLSINAAVAWLPWLLLAALVLIHVPRRRPILWLALATAMQWLAGHAQVAWYSLLLLAAWSTFWAWRVGRWRTVLRVGAGLSFAAALAAIQLLPTLQYLINSQRSVQVQSELAFTYSFWPWRLIGLIAPGAFGSPVGGDYWGYGNFWEDAIYVGLLPLLLALTAIFALRRKPKRRPLLYFMLGSAAVAFVLALGDRTPIFPFLYRYVPSFNMFQAPTRFNLLLVFSLAVLAALGAHYWRQPQGRALYWSRLGLVAAAAVSLGAGFAPLVFADAGSLAIEPTLVKAGLITGVIAFGAASFNLLAPKEGDAPRNAWHWGVAIFLTADLMLAGWGLNPGVDLDFYRTENYDFSELTSQLGQGRLYLPAEDEEILKFERLLRFDSFDTGERPQLILEVLLPNTTLLTGVPSANNFDPILPARYQNWISALGEADADARQAMLARMNVTVLERVDAGGEVTFHVVESLPRLSWANCARIVNNPRQALDLILQDQLEAQSQIVVEMPEGQALELCGSGERAAQLDIVAESPNAISIRVDAPDGGWLLLADSFFPGWETSVGDEEVQIYPGEYLFRAISLRPGTYDLDIMYRPQPFIVGQAISALAVLAFVFLWQDWSWHERKSS